MYKLSALSENSKYLFLFEQFEIFYYSRILGYLEKLY